MGLADRAKDRTSTFSGGMKRRLNLAAALLGFAALFGLVAVWRFRWES